MRPFDREVNDGGDANTEWGYDSDEDGDFIPELLTAGITAMTILRTGKVTFLPSMLLSEED